MIWTDASHALSQIISLTETVEVFLTRAGRDAKMPYTHYVFIVLIVSFGTAIGQLGTSIGDRQNDDIFSSQFQLYQLRIQIASLEEKVKTACGSGVFSKPGMAGLPNNPGIGKRQVPQTTGSASELAVDIELAKHTLEAIKDLYLGCSRGSTPPSIVTTKAPDPCSLISCQNNGTCVSSDGRVATCACLAGYSGKSCEIDQSFKTARFTNLGAGGREGPTSLGSYYDGQDHESLVNVSAGIQYFKVPRTGRYKIEAAGAVGGCGNIRNSYLDYRGRGAVVSGEFNLSRGELLKILVGQKAGIILYYTSGGGGGGTFVVRSDNTPLLVAGGGGGVQTPPQRRAICDGTTAEEGTRGFSPGTTWPGGKDGHGASASDSSDSGGGGGGLLSDGRSGKNYGGSVGYGGEGGKAFMNGGRGGRGYANSPASDGGFGGGAGAFGWGGGAGGGGGYSGGASGDNMNYSCGGGGGSYNSGTNQEGTSGANKDHGYAVISFLG